MFAYLFVFVIGLSAIAEDVEGRLALEHCKTLYSWGLTPGSKYIQGLAESGNHRLLRKLYLAEHEPGISSYAAYVASGSVPDDKIVAFCKQFKVNSPNWGTVFSTLNHRPRAMVVPYIQAVCATGNAKTRYECYRICLSAGWGDLIQQATADLSDETPVDMIIPGIESAILLKEEAQSYVGHFGKQDKGNRDKEGKEKGSGVNSGRHD